MNCVKPFKEDRHKETNLVYCS